jgi:hypothetical protein
LRAQGRNQLRAPPHCHRQHVQVPNSSGVGFVRSLAGVWHGDHMNKNNGICSKNNNNGVWVLLYLWLSFCIVLC